MNNKTRQIIFHKEWQGNMIGDIKKVPIEEAQLLIPDYADIFEKKPTTELETSTTLKLKRFMWFKRLKKDKRFFVEDFLFPKTVTMLFSPPSQFKSYLALYLALCITNQKPFLGLKTKKHPVLYCDKEDNEQIVRERLLKTHLGMKLRKNQFPLYFLVREGNLDDQLFIEKLKDTIKELGIRLVVFDTLHRFSAYEENKADDLNRIYTTVFQPIVDECDCSVLFLHHATKKGDYRGSADFLGMVDVGYSCTRKGTTNGFLLENIKNRFGELEEIHGEIEFEEDATKFLRVSENDLRVDEIGKISKLKEVTEIIKKMFPMVGSNTTRSEIVDHFRIENLDYSIDDIKHSLKWLVRQEWLKNVSRGKYERIEPKQPTQNDQKT